MSNAALIQFYQNNAEILVGNNIAASTVRFIGWWFLKTILVPITDACKSLFDHTFALIDLTQFEGVNNFINSFKPVFIAFMSLSLFALGIMLIFNHEKKPKIVQNICLAILCVTCSTLVFQQINSLVIDIKSGIDEISIVENGEGGSNGVYDIVSSNMIDIYQLDQTSSLSSINYAEDINIVHPDINKRTLSFIDYNEVLDPDEDLYKWKDTNAEDIISNKLVLDGEGKGKITEIYNGALWTSVGNKFYYRYSLKALPTTLSLISLIVLYLALSYKCLRLIYELIFGRLMAYVFSAEISGGQRLTKILVFIRDTYIALLLTVCSEKLYYILSAAISAYISDALMTSLLLVFLAFLVIDGPNLAEKVLGIDIGLSSSWARIIAMGKFAKTGVDTALAPAKAAGMEVMRRYREGRYIDAMKDAMGGAVSESGSNPSFMNSNSSSENGGDSSVNKNESNMKGGARSEEGGAFASQSNNYSDISSNTGAADSKAPSGATERTSEGPNFMGAGADNNSSQAADLKDPENTTGYSDGPESFMSDGRKDKGEASTFMEGRATEQANKTSEQSGKTFTQKDADDATTSRGGSRHNDVYDREETEFMSKSRESARGRRSSLNRKPTEYGGNILKRGRNSGLGDKNPDMRHRDKED